MHHIDIISLNRGSLIMPGLYGSQTASFVSFSHADFAGTLHSRIKGCPDDMIRPPDRGTVASQLVIHRGSLLTITVVGDTRTQKHREKRTVLRRSALARVDAIDLSAIINYNRMVVKINFATIRL